MKSKIDTGGPIHPYADYHTPSRRQGLTLRDHFADLAMQGILGSPGVNRSDYFPYAGVDAIHRPRVSEENADALSKEAYTLADAMIKQSKVKP